jgi:hypothetical protein
MAVSAASLNTAKNAQPGFWRMLSCFSALAAGRKLDPEKLRLAVLVLETLSRNVHVHKTNEPLGK